MPFHQNNAPCRRLIVSMTKHELHFKLFPHPPYSPDLASSNYWLFADLKRMPRKEILLQWKIDIGKWGIFWAQRQIVPQKMHRIVREALESVYPPIRRLCIYSISFMGDTHKVQFCLKVVVVLVGPGTYWAMSYEAVLFCYAKSHTQLCS